MRKFTRSVPGYTLIELLIAMALIGLMAHFCLYSYEQVLQKITALITIGKLKQTISYSRSVAVLQQLPVPVATPNPIAGFTLHLSQSGWQQNHVQVQANGLSHSNGSYRLISQNPSYLQSYTLYFNKALRLYVSTDG